MFKFSVKEHDNVLGECSSTNRFTHAVVADLTKSRVDGNAEGTPVVLKWCVSAKDADVTRNKYRQATWSSTWRNVRILEVVSDEMALVGT